MMMTTRCAIAAVLALSLFATAGPARADAPAGVAQAWSLYHQGRLDEAGNAARAILSPRSKAAAEKRRDACLILAAIAALRGDAWAAEDRVIDALSYDPGYQPDPLHLSPELQSLVRRVSHDRRAEVERRALARRAARSRPVSAPAHAPVPSAAPLPPAPAPSPSPRARTTPLYLAPLPFGIGQFWNGHRRKGWALLISEAALAATSIACLSAALALRDGRGRYPDAVIDAARVLNGVYLGSAYSALALMIYGAIDGLVYRRAEEPSTRTVWLPGPSASVGLTIRREF